MTTTKKQTTEKNSLVSLLEDFKTNNTRNNVYKLELFEGQTKKEKTNTRKKLRGVRDSFLDAILLDAHKKPMSIENAKKELINKKEIVKDFLKFYNSFYISNDFTAHSIIGNNEPAKIEEATKFFTVISDFVKNQK